MITLLKDWTGEVDVNDKHYTSVKDAISEFKHSLDEVHIVLHSSTRKQSQSVSNAITSVSEATERRVTVKKYMTQKASPGFDFMAKFNNDNPMPMRVMQGTVEKETRGMIYMKLHGMGTPTINCSVCGKELTNPVSRHYGIGPICLDKLGIVRDISDIENIREDLVKIEWSGWIIKSAIIESEEVR